MAYYQSKDKIKRIQLPKCLTVVDVFCDGALLVAENLVFHIFVSEIDLKDSRKWAAQKNKQGLK